MTDTSDSTPQPYGPRWCRALSLLAIGVTMHALLPLTALPTVPDIAPLKVAYARPGLAQRTPLLIQRTVVFAPAVSELGADPPQPLPGVLPVSAMGIFGGDRSASLADSDGVPDALRSLQEVAEGSQPSGVATSGYRPTIELNSTPEPLTRPPAPNGEAPPKTPDGGEEAKADLPRADLTEHPLLPAMVLRPADVVVPDAVGRIARRLGAPPGAPDSGDASGTGSPARPASATSAATNPSDEEIVRRLIYEYAGAYERLDVGAAKALRPNVDDKALKRAFEGLSGQRVTLQGCGITISGRTANARCQGSATYQPRIGSRAVQIASGEWTFDLSKKDTAWQIVDTFVR